MIPCRPLLISVTGERVLPLVALLIILETGGEAENSNIGLVLLVVVVVVDVVGGKEGNKVA